MQRIIIFYSKSRRLRDWDGKRLSYLFQSPGSASEDLIFHTFFILALAFELLHAFELHSWPILSYNRVVQNNAENIESDSVKLQWGEDNARFTLNNRGPGT